MRRFIVLLLVLSLSYQEINAQIVSREEAAVVAMH